MRIGVVATLTAAACLAGTAAQAQTWANKLFEVKQHDFGTVARGADVVHRFEARNIYRQDIELVDVRTSCGCTSPSIENPLLATHDVGYVVAKFNTRTFTGVHGATLTVTMRWTDERGITRTGEAQLRVDGDIRSDVVVRPGAVRFDSVDQGQAAEQRIRVSYAGRSNWEVTNVLSKMPDVEVELLEQGRQSGRVTYDLLVRLKDSAPAGNLHGQLVLVTNDGRNQRIPVLVEARIVPEISVAPELVVLGTVRQGDVIAKKVLVRGKKPFRIVDVSCGDKSFSFTAPDDSGQRHVVEVRFRADGDPGEVRQQIEIATDLGDRYRTSCTVYATVVPGETTAGTATQSAADAPGPDSGEVRLATGP